MSDLTSALNEKVQRVIDLEVALREVVERCPTCHGRGFREWDRGVGPAFERPAGGFEGPMVTVYFEYEHREQECWTCKDARRLLGYPERDGTELARNSERIHALHREQTERLKRRTDRT